MSIKVTSLIWEAAPYDDARTMMVLLALGDWANDEGVSWYGVEKIARKARCSVRTVQYILRDLSKADGQGKVMVRVTIRQGRTLTNFYQVNLEWLRQLRRALEDSEAKGANGAPFIPGEMVQPGAKKVQPSAEKVQPSAVKGATAVAPDTLDTSDTLLKRGTAGAAPSVPLLFPGTEPKAKQKERRFQPIVDSIRLCWPDGVPFVFSADDGAALKRMLAKRPESNGWTAERLCECIGFRFMSEGVNVSESVKAWIGAITDYANSPLDRFGKTVCTSDRDREPLRQMARALVGLPSLKPAKAGNLVEMPKRQAYIDSLNANGTLSDRMRIATEKWASLRVYLENRINKHSFDTWMKPAKPLVLTQEGFLVMEVPTQEFAIVGQKYADVMESWMKEQGDDVVMVLWKAFAESSQG